jgi:hypothetical protein
MLPGRTKPAATLAAVFKRLKRKDGISVGVLPRHDPGEITENAALARPLTRG